MDYTVEDIYKQAIDFSNLNQTLSIQKTVLKEKIKSNLKYSQNGGVFNIDISLINFVQFLVDQNRIENVILLDQNENPIMIENLVKFKDEILDRYFKNLYDYYDEYEKIKKARSVEKLVRS